MCANLCCAVPWRAMPCCAVLCCAVLCCAVLCCAVLCCAVLCCAVLCCSILCCFILCCSVLCCAVLCCAVYVLCHTVLCYAVLCCIVRCGEVRCGAVLCCDVLCTCCVVLCCAVVCCGVLCCAVLRAVPHGIVCCVVCDAAVVLCCVSPSGLCSVPSALWWRSHALCCVLCAASCALHGISRFKSVVCPPQVFDMMVRALPSGVRMTAVMDCCHSGTGMDLPFTWTQRGWACDDNPCHSMGDVQLFSGCEDHQTSADVQSLSGGAGGAMTNAFIGVRTRVRGACFGGQIFDLLFFDKKR